LSEGEEWREGVEGVRRKRNMRAMIVLNFRAFRKDSR
jgi:hypothetical protein